jgi:DNA-binding HxlR family transcriptional regulator
LQKAIFPLPGKSLTATLSPVAKRFDQYCPVAHALSLVGERWALLIVRELLRGPKRYTDIVHGLPGIPTNILASRLKDLEGCGVVQKRKLPPPAACTVYELTEYGEGLQEPVYALARWGARSLGPPKADEELYDDWGVNAMLATFHPQEARGLTATYVLKVDDDVFTARLSDGVLEPSVGEAPDADLVIETDRETFFLLCGHQLEPRTAVKDGRLRFHGSKAALERYFQIFTFAEPVTAAA